jgi:hypothetical protein
VGDKWRSAESKRCFVAGQPVKRTITVADAKHGAGRTIDEPTRAELDWIVANLEKARDIVGKGKIELSDLDVAWGRWLGIHDPEVEDPNPTINAFGIAFGQYIIDDLGLHWAVVADEHSTEICVHGQPGDVLVYPCNFVAKRYVTRSTDFFVMFYAEMQKDIPTLQKMWTQTKPKPWWKIW